MARIVSPARVKQTSGAPVVVTGPRGGLGTNERAVVDGGVSIVVGSGALSFEDLDELIEVARALRAEVYRVGPTVRGLLEAHPEMPRSRAFQQAEGK